MECERSPAQCPQKVATTAVGPGEDGAAGLLGQGTSQNADLPSIIPHERWDIEAAYAPDVAVGRMYVRSAGFLPSVETFDAGAFRSVCLTLHQLPRGRSAVVLRSALLSAVLVKVSKTCQ